MTTRKVLNQSLIVRALPVFPTQLAFLDNFHSITSTMADFKPYSEQPELHPQAPYRSALLTHPGNLRKALKDALADPAKTLFGVAHGIPSTFVTKVIASTQPDFVWIDVEHGMFNRLELHE
jgi:4-hydroxy-2-oxoheptanedioate aldolase